MSDDPFSQCPSGCVCGVRELVARAHDNGLREAEDVDAAEMRALLTAVRSGYEEVRSDSRLPQRRAEADTAWARADRELAAMETMLNEGQLRRAAAHVQEAEGDAGRGKRRSAWLRKVRWPVIVGIGLFDVYYFNQVFRYLTSQTGDAANAPGGSSGPGRGPLRSSPAWCSRSSSRSPANSCSGRSWPGAGRRPAVRRPGSFTGSCAPSGGCCRSASS